MRKLSFILLLAWPMAADEGMWLFNEFPKARVKAQYGFDVTDAFLDKLQLGSVKMGASGSFVSPDGLVFTNHHVGLSCVQRLSSSQNNYVADTAVQDRTVLDIGPLKAGGLLDGVGRFQVEVSASRNLAICWVKSTVWPTTENAITCSSAYSMTPAPVSKNC
jgi:hypothetical protein